MMTTIEKIKAEIERMHQEAVLTAIGNDTEWLRSRIGTLVDIMDFLSTLESEKPMQGGLEEELDRFITSGKSITIEDCGTYKVSYHDFKKVARHFAQWGKEQGYREGFLEGTKIQREEDDQLVDTIYQQGIEKGKDDMKEQAVSGTLAYEPHLRRIIVNLDDIPDGAWNGGGTPVEVIIFKKEQVTYERSTTSGI